MKTRQQPKVLVIDDEGDLSELLQIALSQDYTIEAVFDGRAALKRLEEFQPQLIVTDAYSPSQDGFSVIDEIHKISKVPIILVSEDKQHRKAPHLQDKGITAIMIKPFTLKDLRDKVKAVLAL